MEKIFNIQSSSVTNYVSTVMSLGINDFLQVSKNSFFIKTKLSGDELYVEFKKILSSDDQFFIIEIKPGTCRGSCTSGDITQWFEKQKNMLVEKTVEKNIGDLFPKHKTNEEIIEEEILNAFNELVECGINYYSTLDNLISAWTNPKRKRNSFGIFSFAPYNITEKGEIMITKKINDLFDISIIRKSCVGNGIRVVYNNVRLSNKIHERIYDCLKGCAINNKKQTK